MGAKRHEMQHRFLLLGLLYGASEAVVRPLLETFDATLASGSSAFDEDLVTSALRALIDLNVLSALESCDALLLCHRILDVKPYSQHCCSAFFGFLGAVSLATAAMEPALIDSIARTAFQTADYYLPKYNTDGLIFELLWALHKAFQAYGETSRRRWADKCGNLLEAVLNDEYLKRFDEDVDYNSNAVQALREAQQLKELFEQLHRSKPTAQVAR